MACRSGGRQCHSSLSLNPRTVSLSMKTGVKLCKRATWRSASRSNSKASLHSFTNRRLPSGENETRKKLERLPRKDATSSRVARSHTRTVASQHVEASRLPSLEIATRLIWSLCPARSTRRRAEETSHTEIVPLRWPKATCVLSGENCAVSTFFGGSFQSRRSYDGVSGQRWKR